MSNISFKTLPKGFAYSSDADSDYYVVRYTNAPLRWLDDPTALTITFSIGGGIGFSAHTFSTGDNIVVDGAPVVGNHAAKVLFFESFFNLGGAVQDATPPDLQAVTTQGAQTTDRLVAGSFGNAGGQSAVMSQTIATIVALSQAEYDGLADYDPSTLYFII